MSLLEDVGLLGYKHVLVPPDPNICLQVADDFDLLKDPSLYRCLIGKLLYFTVSRPDITFAINKLSQFVSRPGKTHLGSAYYLLLYLKSSPGYDIFLSASPSFQSRAFTDVDWGSCIYTRRSSTVFCVFLGDSMVSWKAKKQSTISRSFAEAEYQAMATTTCELVWLANLLSELQVSFYPACLIVL